MKKKKKKNQIEQTVNLKIKPLRLKGKKNGNH